jgi:hypothetical protein
LTSTFRDDHREIQELVRELVVLREHNLQFKPGESAETLLLFSEAAIVLVAIERFVRAVLGDAQDHETNYHLLQRAVCKGLLRVPWDNQEEGIRKIKEVRNTLLHGNYEKAARDSGCANVTEYFLTTFAGEVEDLFKVAQALFKQIDPVTGKPLAQAHGA